MYRISQKLLCAKNYWVLCLYKSFKAFITFE
jgi:hypothetical protein